MVKLLSSCPALETLELSCFRGFHRLEITSPNLKRLILDGGGGYDSFEIVAPHLQHLEISGDRGYLKRRLVNVSSLVTASLTFSIICITVDDESYIGEEEDDVEEDNCPDYHQAFRNLVLHYLEKLSHVTQLKIGSWLAEVVFMLQLEGVALPELRCKCLTLEMPITKNTLYGVASLLWSSLLLETLNIHLGVGIHMLLISPAIS
ncbi:F-box/LRR-repeat protein At3g03360-like [Nicotiana tabacum]|uniref:F-box/LRR-repeat protein At3g03360-like n=1 Tax=Nicotiana tabacum TaxID=4097 RepID=A0AC58SBW6_TOBAC